MILRWLKFLDFSEIRINMFICGLPILCCLVVCVPQRGEKSNTKKTAIMASWRTPRSTKKAQSFKTEATTWYPKTTLFSWMFVDNHFLLDGMFVETTIFYVKIWFIIQLKQPLKKWLFRVPGKLFEFKAWGGFSDENPLPFFGVGRRLKPTIFQWLFQFDVVEA